MSRFVCNGCDYETLVKTNIINHTMKLNPCCNFQEEPRFTTHIKEKKVKEKKCYYCRICDKELSCASNRKRHENTCQNIRTPIPMPTQEPISEIKPEIKPKDEGVIYLLHISPHEENICKLGKSSNFMNRIQSYKNVLPIIRIVTASNNISIDEKELLKIFSQKFVNCSNRGKEYFSGSVEQMTHVVHKYFMNR